MSIAPNDTVAKTSENLNLSLLIYLYLELINTNIIPVKIETSYWTHHEYEKVVQKVVNLLYNGRFNPKPFNGDNIVLNL